MGVLWLIGAVIVAVVAGLAISSCENRTCGPNDHTHSAAFCATYDPHGVGQ
jgi:hypothetical protein